MDTREQLSNIISMCGTLMEQLNADKARNDDSGLNLDFNVIKGTASGFHYANPLWEYASENQKYSYIGMLLYLFKDLENEQQLSTVLVQIEKLLIAAGIELNLEEELVASHKISKEKLSEQIQDLTEMDLKQSQMFVMDSMYILVAADVKAKEIHKNLAALYSKLGIPEEQMRELFTLIRIVVNKDKTEYEKFMTKELTIDLKAFEPYINGFMSGILANSGQFCWVKGQITYEGFRGLSEKLVETQKDFSWLDGKEIIRYGFSNTRCLFENCTVTLSDDFIISSENIQFVNCKIIVGKSQFYFNGCQNIVFRGCTITKVSKPLDFKECEQILFDHCTFEGTEEVRCFETRKCKVVRIQDSTFEKFTDNEKSKESWSCAYAGCLLISEAQRVILLRDQFESCYAKNWERGKVGSAVASIYCSNIKIEQCQFKNCFGKCWKYGSHWDDEGYLFEFSAGVEVDLKNNTFTNCLKRERN